MNDELVRLCEEVVVDYLEVLSRKYSEEAEENHAM
jgi:hypothetical protein